jgi:adenylate cyclase
VGFSDIVDDEGGVVRRGLLQVDDGKRHWNSLSMSLALAYLAPRGAAPANDPQRSGALRLGKTRLVPLEPDDGGYSAMDAGGFQILLDYRGMPKPFARTTLGELLDGKVESHSVAGRIAIIGSSAESLRDFFPTPFDALLPAGQRTTGMELHAHLASQLVRLGLGESEPLGTLSGRVRWLSTLPFALLGLLAFRLGAAAGIAYLVAGAAASACLAYAAMLRGFWFPPVAPALAFALAAMAGLAARLAAERAERKTLMTLFARHVSPEVAQTLWRERAALLEKGRLKPLQMTATILFADIRGYTPLAEQLDSLGLAQWLGEFMDAMSRAVLRHHGMVRQFAGDALLAAFGAPFPRRTPEEIARDARNAVACALDMLDVLAQMESGWAARGLPATGLRIGIHTGPVVACSVGSSERLEYALVGDVVNIAARLQTYEDAQPETHRILMSDATAKLVAGACAAHPAGPLTFRGRSTAIEAHRVSRAP